MAQQIPLSTSSLAVDFGRDYERDDGTHEVAPDVAYRRLAIVNVMFIGDREAGDRGWVLVDCGLPGMARFIRSAAAARFGKARPGAIILTHGHFDHVGALPYLANIWDAPVYAHPLECPYLDGTSAYPAPDPAVGGGVMAALSPLYPRGPTRLGERLRPLPGDGTVPELPGWSWRHTPGHSVGHISLWRAADRMLIAGDAIVTTAQESAYAAITQAPEMHGPPAYYTVDWEASRHSVKELAALQPETVLAGHGRPMHGDEMRCALHDLGRHFDEVARPKQGRYVARPALVSDRSAYS